MHAEVISIGDELISGQRLDTNAQWLSQQLSELGIPTIRHTTVGDDLAGNIEALRLAAGRAAVVICTGGLGPTLDDLTRQAMAEAFDLPLELDEASLKHIEEMFSRRGREMPASNRLQAMFPHGSRVIPNPHGSAPGVDLIVSRNPGVSSETSRIFALPGVPAEMKQMWHETVVPRIEESLHGNLGRLRYHSIKLFGIGESDVEVKLPDLIDRRRMPTVGITVSRATITLRIAARARSDDEFATLIAPTVQEIDLALGDLIFGGGDDELEHAVLRQLAARRLSLASVEIGAASWVCDWMLKTADTRSIGAESNPYVGGLAFPSLQLAQQWLSVEQSDEGCVWTELARRVQQRSGAAIGLAIGSYPNLSQMELSGAPFDFVFALAIGDDVCIQRSAMGGHPDVLGPRVAKTGLDLLRRQLAQLP